MTLTQNLCERNIYSINTMIWCSRLKKITCEHMEIFYTVTWMFWSKEIKIKKIVSILLKQLVNNQKHFIKNVNNLTFPEFLTYVQKMDFFITMAKNVKFTTVEILVDIKIETILKCIDTIINIYKTRGIKVSSFLMDR